MLCVDTALVLAHAVLGQDVGSEEEDCSGECGEEDGFHQFAYLSCEHLFSNDVKFSIDINEERA